MSDPILATSNVIELKPDHKYLLILKGDPINPVAVKMLANTLKEQGILGITIALASDQSLEVIEVPTPAPEPVEPPYIVRGEE
jgi:hypothetical protein